MRVCVCVLYSEDQGLEFTCEGGLLLVGEDVLSGPQNFESLQKLRLGFEVRVGFRVTFYVRVGAKCLTQGPRPTLETSRRVLCLFHQGHWDHR